MALGIGALILLSALRVMTKHFFVTVMTVFTLAAGAMIVLSGCQMQHFDTSAQRIGPYDLTLSSHREALFGKPRR